MKKTKQVLLALSLGVALFVPTSKAYMASKNQFENGSLPPYDGRDESSYEDLYGYLSASQKEYELWVKDGRNYMKRKEYEQAILAFRKAKALKPAADEARYLLGCAYEKRQNEGLFGDTTDFAALAADEYRQAIILADNLPARYNLALLCRQNGDFENARIHLEHILAVSENKFLRGKAKEELNEVIAQHLRPKMLKQQLAGFKDR
ncbi:MAG: tetratricopeptide repeat protein [Candidatus Riflebacteria bacterium]|nr:tetratricopeptide repeat protein [Candidatus Riflebacteria bacterium]